MQKRASQKRRPGNVVFGPDKADPRREVQWQTGLVNAVIQYVDIVPAVFASLLQASELLASGGICVMMEQRLGTKPLVEHIKLARHNVSSVAEGSRELLQDMAQHLSACMEKLTQAERAKSEYDHYTKKVSLLNEESAKNEIARMEEQSDVTRSRSGELAKKISEKVVNHRAQSLAEKLARNQEKLQRWSVCVEESEKLAFDSWQACRRRVDELGSLADRIVCEVVRALGSVAVCEVSMRSSITAPTSYGSAEHFTVRVCPVLESESPDHGSGHVEETDAAPPVDGPLHVDEVCPAFRQIDDAFQQDKERSAAGGDFALAHECGIHDRPSPLIESDIRKEFDVRPGEANMQHDMESRKFQDHVHTAENSAVPGFTASNGDSLEHSVPPVSLPAASGCAVGQKGAPCCGQYLRLFVPNERALVRVQGESVDDASAVTVLIGNEAMLHPETNLQLRPSISNTLIDRLHKIPAHLRQISRGIARKLLKSIAILPDDLFSLNEAVFNVPVGSRIDANATFLLFELMEQIHLVFRHGRYNKSDQNFLRDYVALLGTMQNQPFFDSQQGRAFHTWLFEALSGAPT